jgi:hypothetical protein
MKYLSEWRAEAVFYAEKITLEAKYRKKQKVDFSAKQIHSNCVHLFQTKETTMFIVAKLQGFYFILQKLFFQHLVIIHQIKNCYLSEESAASVFIFLP